MQVLDHNIIDDYITELRALSVEVTGLTSSERIRYRYSPDFIEGKDKEYEGSR